MYPGDSFEHLVDTNRNGWRLAGNHSLLACRLESCMVGSSRAAYISSRGNQLCFTMSHRAWHTLRAFGRQRRVTKHSMIQDSSPDVLDMSLRALHLHCTLRSNRRIILRA